MTSNSTALHMFLVFFFFFENKDTFLYNKYSAFISFVSAECFRPGLTKMLNRQDFSFLHKCQK